MPPGEMESIMAEHDRDGDGRIDAVRGIHTCKHAYLHTHIMRWSKATGMVNDAVRGMVRA